LRGGGGQTEKKNYFGKNFLKKILYKKKKIKKKKVIFPEKVACEKPS